jgi:hypothetical protein
MRRFLDAVNRLLDRLLSQAFGPAEAGQTPTLARNLIGVLLLLLLLLAAGLR